MPCPPRCCPRLPSPRCTRPAAPPRSCPAPGYRIAAWTVNDPARARLLLDWGMDAIFTDELATIRPAV
ncbi:glycerophosphoryl diester phosphodiesterase [Bordetella pertussis]|nr:glycerophosphoryl diester phosphodiesterase [Bordetella pertussis]